MRQFRIGWERSQTAIHDSLQAIRHTPLDIAYPAIEWAGLFLLLCPGPIDRRLQPQPGLHVFTDDLAVVVGPLRDLLDRKSLSIQIMDHQNIPSLGHAPRSPKSVTVHETGATPKHPRPT